ncbi:Alkylated DNA nucleotide flippase Atl1, participates in nucleotide excision repair, Ada-like DNA-binding domain [Friedmanniella luteola]|uniref:Alkylated DNA nucleotide flippase Atl1, participates in nucleotide excision repair, Ada-like DNA-binding domain n=1 Tax=Friedmanniella luteola TaxID=546871 RepID=A0A1H1VMF8_9ACTN|nr:MGMT family protein [Friedmanniella luteola]SDS85865.1 Alkylated DNA nucleotide flippase Atl1, participates in nucleotide excision repair, Ada-like DNA-binding domain [Friedmanniella luteola]
MTGEPFEPGAADPEAYVEAVLRLVEQVPAGRVTTYGDLAEAVGRGGPRQVGHVMATWGGGVPWWRVVRADGSPARGLEQEALRRLAAEGAPLRGRRVVLVEARQPPAGHRPGPPPDVA